MMAGAMQSLGFKVTFISCFPETEASMVVVLCLEYKSEWAGVAYRNDHHNPGATGGKESNP